MSVYTKFSTRPSFLGDKLTSHARLTRLGTNLFWPLLLAALSTSLQQACHCQLSCTCWHPTLFSAFPSGKLLWLCHQTHGVRHPSVHSCSSGVSIDTTPRSDIELLLPQPCIETWRVRRLGILALERTTFRQASTGHSGA